MTWTLADLEEHLLIGSTLVEGSTLSEDEARAVLAGKTVSGHPVEEARELINYRAATAWLLAELERSPFLSVDLVLDFHRRLLAGGTAPCGVFKRHVNFTYRTDGKRHDYVHPSRVLHAMQEWIDAFNAPKASAEPASGAAELYARFQQIHPFDDGNGRTGRLLVAYWLHWKHHARFRFYAADKLAHLRAVERTDDDDLSALVEFFRARTSP